MIKIMTASQKRSLDDAARIILEIYQEINYHNPVNGRTRALTLQKLDSALKQIQKAGAQVEIKDL